MRVGHGTVAAKPEHCQMLLAAPETSARLKQLKEPERAKRRWEGERNDAEHMNNLLWLYAWMYMCWGRGNIFALLKKKKVTVILKFPLLAESYGVNFSVPPSHLFLSACSLLSMGLLTGLFFCCWVFFVVVWSEEKFLFLHSSRNSIRNFLETCQYLLQALICSCLIKLCGALCSIKQNCISWVILLHFEG